MDTRIKVALSDNTDYLRERAERLEIIAGDKYQIVGSGEEFDIMMIPYENFRQTRTELSQKLGIAPDQICTYEELRVMNCEEDILNKYHTLWNEMNTAGILPFKDKTVLVIGGGSGIGKECALAFERAGANVVIAGRNKEKLQDTISNFPNGKVKYLCWDISKNIKENPIRIKEAEELFGTQIDVLINCAGVWSRESFWEVQEETWDLVMDINIKGMYFVCQAFAKYFIDKHIKGHIVNVLSNNGILPTVKPYGISKWGGIGLTKGLGMHLAEYGITVNGIAPGGVATEMVGVSPGDCPARRSAKNGRIAFPCEVAQLIMQLAGFMGENMPGEILICDGGDKVINWCL